ncbi:rihA, partial [Symbiodinium necroappetens]
QSTDTELGGGWTACRRCKWSSASCFRHSLMYFASGKGTCSANSKTFKSVWLWVYSLNPPPPKGNWKLALKVGKTATLGFSNALWTNSDLLNAGSALAKEEDAKYSAFNTEPFKRVRMCVGSPESNCVEHVFSKKYDNAKALFSAGYIRDETVKRDEILSNFGPAKDSYQDCPMQRPGFNIECNDGNKARWGFCLNCASQGCQNDDGNDADAAIGIGIAGQSTDTELGGGWTA